MRIAAATFSAGAAVALAAIGAAAATGSSPALLAVGDSLSVGAAPYLERELPGYRIERAHAIGLKTDDVAEIVSRARRTLPGVLVVSAGTNDDPRTVSAFSRSISDIVATAGPKRCLVWPTIARPPVAGVSYDGMNRALARAAALHSNLVLVDWVGMVSRHPRWLRADRVHAGTAGYRARAAAIAVAVKTRCAS